MTIESSIWADGVFDCYHTGHANAFRQSSKLGERLFAGVHSDADVQLQKGAAPVMTEEERVLIVGACKWVDHVVGDAPWTTDLAVCEQHCGSNFYVAHGNDDSLSHDGSDPYEYVKKAGRLKHFERTKGVSTTDLVSRLLEHESNQQLSPEERSPYTGGNSFLLPSSLLAAFYDKCKPRKKGDSVVYIHGAFDILHPGHLDIIKEASRQYDHVIVGVWKDEVVTKHRGEPYPILSMQERSLMVLSLRGVDDVILGAPSSIDDKFLSMLDIDSVLAGPSMYGNFNPNENVSGNKLKILSIDSKFADFSYLTLTDRVLSRRHVYEERNRKKEARELASIKNKSVA
ncbi:hypothetical protein P9112_013818 [Eukaryota sp. TZLM1-RC]